MPTHRRVPMMALAAIFSSASTLAAQGSTPAEAKGETIISVTMMGPYVMTYVRPADEPWAVFPYGY